MMMRLWLLSFGIMACVHTPPEEALYRFPKDFFAEQDIDFSGAGADRSQALLAQIQVKDGKLIALVFLDRLSLMPFALYKDGTWSGLSPSKEAEHVKSHLEDGRRLIESLYAKPARLDAEDSSRSSWQDESGARYRIGGIKPFGSCSFPAWIMIELDGKTSISVKNRKVRCGQKS